MRFAFRDVPHGGGVRPRPIVDVVVEGLDIAPQACLLDSGATAIRFAADLAELCGIDLAKAPSTQLGVTGGLVTAHMAEVSLAITDGHDRHEWTAPAWFCTPWTASFGLLGLTGFFDQFVVTIAAYDEQIEVVPINS